MMFTRPVGWQELFLLVSCSTVIPFIAGLVLLIVGLTQRKRGLWIGGLIVMLAPLALVLLTAAVLLLARLA